MKRIIIIAFVLLASVKINAQRFTTYADTANYLISQIENKKDDYNVCAIQNAQRFTIMPAEKAI